MPKGLYFTAVVFSFFLLFSTPKLRSHWTDLNHTWTYIHLWLLFEKFGPNSPGHLPPRAGGINTFLGRLWTWPNISMQQNIISTIGLLCMPPNLVTFGPQTDENGWRVFTHHLNFASGDTSSLTAWTLYNKQQASFGTCYVVAWAYSLEQQNAGRAQAELCHASRLNINRTIACSASDVLYCTCAIVFYFVNGPSFTLSCIFPIPNFLDPAFSVFLYSSHHCRRAVPLRQTSCVTDWLTTAC